MNFKNMLLFTLLISAGFVGTFVHGYVDEKTNVQKEFIRKMDEQAKLKIQKQDVKNVKELVAISSELNKLVKVYYAMSQTCHKHCFSRESEDEYISQDSIEGCAYMWRMGAKANAVAEARRAVREAIMNIRNDFSDEQESEIASALAEEQEENEKLFDDVGSEAKDDLAEAIMAE